MSRQSTHLHVLGNVPAELVDGETALGGLLAADEIDVGFLHELDGFSLYEIVRFVERELGGDTGGALAARLIVAVVGQRATHELHQALVGGDEARHLLPLVRSLSDLARHALVVRVVLLVERIANPPLALVQRRLQHLPSCHPHTHAPHQLTRRCFYYLRQQGVFMGGPCDWAVGTVWSPRENFCYVNDKK